MDSFLILLLIVSGLSLGSFLGALTYRLPKGESVFKGRSKCPSCGEQISWFDNIPLLSYLLLGGKCRHCNEKIPSRYFLIEFLTATGFVASYFGLVHCANISLDLPYVSPMCTLNDQLPGLLLPVMLFVFLIVVSIFVIDFEHRFIPDEFVFFGFTALFLVFVFFSPSSIYIRMLSAFGAGIFLLLIHLLTKGKGMGLGDVKFAVFAGILLGWPFTPVFLFLAFLTGALVGIILVLTSRAGLKKQIAFGPFLVVSLIVTFAFGERLITLFLP
jgi:leader peptidase (prepilin peptidase)/N-methyltransferase